MTLYRAKTLNWNVEIGEYLMGSKHEADWTEMEAFINNLGHKNLNRPKRLGP